MLQGGFKDYINNCICQDAHPNIYIVLPAIDFFSKKTQRMISLCMVSIDGNHHVIIVQDNA